MVTLYLTGTSIRLESRIVVGEHMLQKYREFKEKTPKEFSINRTKKGCFAYLTERYSGKDIATQACKLDDENENIVECLSKMKTEDEKNLDACVKVLRDSGHNLLADWVYKKLTTALEAQDEEVEKEPELSELETQDEQEKPHDTCDSSIVDLPEFESYLCLMLQKFRTKGMCTNGEIIDYVNEHSQKLKDILCHAWSEKEK